jgi:nucleotide-binding universal stress UspA family protein
VYERILVPTDGSACSAAAVDHALTVAERFDAVVHALYVVEADVVDHSAPAVDPETIREALRSEGADATAAVATRATARGVASVESVLEGVPVDAVLDYVDGEGIDLVVMGTHGRRGLDRYLVGSVTERVVRRADVPVLVVRDEA